MIKIFYLLLFFLPSISNIYTELPDISLKGADGKMYELQKDFAEKDKLYVFSFWATWCVPCLAELDEINDQYDDWKKELNFELIAVATDDARTEKRVNPLATGKGWTYRILFDSNQELKRRLGIVDVPHTIVVKNNKIVYTHSGYSPGDEADLYDKLKTL